MDTTTISSYSLLVAVLAASAWVTVSVMRNIDKIGNLPEIKTEAISRALFNFYAIAVLCVVVIVRHLGPIDTGVFTVLLAIILTGLGLKLAIELKFK